LLKRNVGIFESLIEKVLEVNDHGILLIASNPVDVMSYSSLKNSVCPVHRVIGSGTLLDSARFRYLFGDHLDIDARSVHAHIVGEHGDSEVPVWSLANVAGTEVSVDEQTKERIFTNTRDAAYAIIE